MSDISDLVEKIREHYDELVSKDIEIEGLLLLVRDLVEVATTHENRVDKLEFKTRTLARARRILDDNDETVGVGPRSR